MISVIIPTCNRSALLKETLSSLLNQTLTVDKFEVIVIDNASKDNTYEVVSDFSKLLEDIRYFHEPEPGLHAARHRGMRESKGEILVFADDDIVALPTWLEGIQESFQNKVVGLVGGKNIPQYEISPPLWVEALWESTDQGRYITYYSLLDLGEKIKEIHPHFVFGCNFSIRKSILEQVKGFHPDGLPSTMLKYRGDGETFVAEQVTALGYVALYNPKASVHHKVSASRLNLDYINKRAFAEGITQSYTDTRKKFLYASSKNKFSELLIDIKKRLIAIGVSDLQKQILKSLKAGYRYHQSELKKDKALLDWVLKDNYL